MKALNILFYCVLVLIICNDQIYGQDEAPEIQNILSTYTTLNEERKLEMNVSDKIDPQLVELRQLIINQGFDPMDLPNVDKKFEARPVLFKHNGRIKLTKGWMTQLSNIQRDGDAVLIPRLGTKQLIKCTLQIEEIDFGYNYSLKLGLLIHRWGKIKGSLKHFKVYFEIYYDLVLKYVQVKKINIIDDGAIKVKITGNILTDGFYQKTVQKLAEEAQQQLVVVVQQKLNESIDLINEKLKPKRGQLSQEEIDFQREIEAAYLNYMSNNNSTQRTTY